jgi:hypothetical protein
MMQRMMEQRKPEQAELERVYQAIYDQLKRTHALPTYGRLARALRLHKDDIRRCVEALRQQERIEKTTLLPTDFRQRWRELPRLRDF